MKGSFGILSVVLLLLIGIAIFVMFGPALGQLSIIIIEVVIAAAIITLLVRYYRRSS